MVDIDADDIIALEVAESVPFYPASVKILLLKAIWPLDTALKQLFGFDFLVLLAGIALGQGRKSHQ